MIADPHHDLESLLEQDDLIEQAMQTAVREALRIHKAARNPIATWRDGQVVWLQPEEVTLEEPIGEGDA